MNTFRQTILVVEDETLVRFAIADALEDAGHRVLEAGNVLEAVGQLGLREDIALVLTDVDMPGGLNGVDLARMVAECAPHIGIIVSSARRLPDLPELPAAARYLPKPGTAATMLAMVDEVMAESGRCDDARRQFHQRA